MCMGLKTNRRSPEAGFSLIEVLAVVAIIAIMAAVALPNIGQYIRNYRIRGAAQQVAGEIQSARTKAIMTNTNTGVSFVVIDQDTYRFIREDATNVTDPDRFGPLRDLPMGVQFVPGALGYFRYNRLGSWCQPALPGCPAALPTTCLSAETPRCTQVPGNYVTITATTGVTITVLEAVTGLRREIRVSPGGRVMPVQ